MKLLISVVIVCLSLVGLSKIADKINVLIDKDASKSEFLIGDNGRGCADSRGTGGRS